MLPFFTKDYAPLLSSSARLATSCFVHSFKTFKFDPPYLIDLSFAVPASKRRYKIFNINSTEVKAEFDIAEYKRAFTSIRLPIIVDIMQQNLPQGVRFSFQKFDPDIEESLYVPRLELTALAGELSKIGKVAGN
ncbi:unnamed protein product [Protopolystoma xenopodis]|uniref:Ribosomal protein S10 domain-containing protein n=1 Tax=Protopolystoma xenopodis TaxID=117903 RepID=A0A448XAX7_9PLAT|nr:unnamed protein product [Protopolystoma xenopodis]